MSTTTLTIGGSAVNMAQSNLWPRRLSLRLDGYSTLTLERRGFGPLPGLPDPFLAKTVVLAIDGTTYFVGDVVDWDPDYTETGWTISYQCRDLRYRGDRIPFTDANTKTDSGSWNLPGDDRDWIAGRAGKEVGEILAAVLTMDANASGLSAKGIGGYVDNDPWTLPSETLADLAALSSIPPNPVNVQGERMLTAIESFLSAWAPNHSMWIRPSDGVIRFLDRRVTTEHVLTLETDPISPTPIRRSVAGCYQRVINRGQPIAEPMLVSLASGGLEEDFAYGALDNAAAKAAYDPSDEAKDKEARSQGTCSCSDAVTAVLTSNPGTQAWAEDEWDQEHRLGVLYLWKDGGSGITQFATRRVVSNTAKSSGGTSTFTLEYGLPATDYDHYYLYGISSGASLVYRKYKVVDPDIAAAMTRQFTYGAVWVGMNGDVATATSAPMGATAWSASGDPPYEERPVPFTFDPTNGTIIFATSTYKAAGNHVPTDVRVLLAVNTGVLTSTKPASGFEGTSNTVEGLEETLTVMVDGWRDPANQANMDVFTQDLLDSVKDTIVEGVVTYHGLYIDALTFGIGLSVTGSSYTTGWEDLNIPVVAVDVLWNSGSPWHYTTAMAVSNRRSHLSTGALLAPDRPRDGAILGDPNSSARGNVDLFSSDNPLAQQKAIGSGPSVADMFNQASSNADSTAAMQGTQSAIQSSRDQQSSAFDDALRNAGN